MANEKDGKYGPGNTIKQWNGGSRENYEKWQADRAKMAANTGTADGKDRARDAMSAKRTAEESAGRMRVGKRLDKKDSMTALRRLAEAKASSKMSKTSKIGKMLDKKEMSDAPRRPSVTKTTKKPAFFETMKSSKKKSGK